MVAQHVEQVYAQQILRKESVFKLLSKRWTVQVLLALQGGARFSELKWKLGISAKSLSARLSELIARGLVIKTIYAEVPVRMEYELTARGAKLASILSELDAWERND